MFRNSTGSSQIKDIHAMKVLGCVRRQGAVSRTDVSQLEGMSKSTVTRIVDELIAEGFLIETGQMTASSSRRKPIALQICPDRYRCIGVNATRNSLRCVMTDFAAGLIGQTRASLRDVNDTESLIAVIADAIRTLIAETHTVPEQVLGAGIGMPGLVDNATGTVVNFASESILPPIPLASRLEEEFGFPIFVDNNVNAYILSEQFFNVSEDTENCVFVNCWDGIGSAAIINGTLLRGYSNSVGEIGHMIVQPGGRRCRCGKEGCAEMYCSPESLLGDVSLSLNRGRTSHIESDRLTLPQLLVQYESGDALCREHVNRAAQYLSICLSNVINVLNPKTLILSGELFETGDTLFNIVREMTLEKLISQMNQSVVFIRRSRENPIYRLGAVSLVFADFYGALS